MLVLLDLFFNVLRSILLESKIISSKLGTSSAVNSFPCCLSVKVTWIVDMTQQ